MKNKTVLVYSGMGAQGSAITRALIANGHNVRALTRSEKNDDIIKSNGASPMHADLGDLASLKEATNGCNAIVLTLPLAFDIDAAVGWADNVIQAAQDAAVKCLVFNASGPIPKNTTGVAAIDIKLLVAEKLAQSGLPVITLQPTLYMGNLAAPWTAPAITHQGTLAYPLPEQQQVSWISWENMAEFAAAAVEHTEFAGQSFRIGGSKALSGTDIAKAFAIHLSQPISYCSVALNDFEKGLNHALGEPAGTEIAKLYKWFSGEGADSLNVDNTDATQALGIVPNDFDDWIKTVDWKNIAGTIAAS
ncbi:MAG: NmrA family NAD(P)-binding protein [Gammaproteobacteria bacterium]|nr:NmrA family NAD(P)-binding protein [Gammaproteobacteria bacterium]